MTKTNLEILIVEDDSSKAFAVTECIKLLKTSLNVQCTVASDFINAKRELERSKFDIAIVDIQIPLRFGDIPDPQGGGRLVREFDTNSKLQRPRYVVALSAYADADITCDQAFSERAFSFIHYEKNSAQWSSQLLNLLSHISIVSDVTNELGISQEKRPVDLAIVCALDEPELGAILQLPWAWKEISDVDDCIVSHRGIIKAVSGDRTVVAVAAMEPGMSAAAALTSRAIEQFSPRYVVMTGISGGIRGASELGDIVVAESVWDYTNGKRAIVSGKPAFRPSPRVIDIDALVVSQIKRVTKIPGLLEKIKQNWPATKPNTSLTARFGPVFTGSAVVADPAFIDALIDMHRKLVGIEMEAYAVLCATKYSAEVKPIAFILKSISDFADNEKDDDWQAYASYTSACLLNEWASRFL